MKKQTPTEIDATFISTVACLPYFDKDDVTVTCGQESGL